MDSFLLFFGFLSKLRLKMSRSLNLILFYPLFILEGACLSLPCSCAPSFSKLFCNLKDVHILIGVFLTLAYLLQMVVTPVHRIMTLTDCSDCLRVVWWQWKYKFCFCVLCEHFQVMWVTTFCFSWKFSWSVVV